MDILYRDIIICAIGMIINIVVRFDCCITLDEWRFEVIVVWKIYILGYIKILL